MIEPSRVVLHSYGGTALQTDLYEPANESELRDALGQITQARRTVSFRTGGMAFDTQSLNSDCVVSLAAFTKFELDEVAHTLTVGAANSWGDVVDRLSARGFVPYVTVSTRGAACGGTASADCLSRFSPTAGKEGAHIESIRLLRVDGVALHCSREQNEPLFRAAVAGMGYLGVITEITYRVLPLGYAGDEIAVRTDFVPFKGIAELAERLVPAVEAALCSHADVTRDPCRARAVAAVLYLDGPRHGVLMSSHYLQSRDKDPNYLFRPRSVPHLLTQLVFLFPRLRRFAWGFAFRRIFNRTQTSVDALDGFTFFQEGNVAIKKAARKLGVTIRTRQQTYVVPRVPADMEASKQQLRAFLDAADAYLDGVGLVPALIDVLYLPADDDEGFVLSSSNGMSGYAITFSFETFYAGRIAAIEAALSKLSELLWEGCRGRVHLVKHVFAPAGLIEAMYPDWRTMQQRRGDVESRGMLQNGFLERTFPGLCE